MIPPRVEVLASVAEVEAELERLGCDSTGRTIMGPKGVVRIVRLRGIDPRAANILKQEFLAKGGECALPRAVYELERGATTDALIISSERSFLEVLRILPAQPYGLKALGAALAEALRRASEPARTWRCGSFVLDTDKKTHVMGVVNATPDSFSGADDYVVAGRVEAERATAHAARMVQAGADIIDIGGESTRPGAAAVDEEEELRRVMPIIEGLAGDDATRNVPVSIDTRKPAVAEKALAAGAAIINDVGGFRDEEMIAVAAESPTCGLVVMHMKGEPQTMQEQPHYDDLVGEIYDWLAERTEALTAAGVERTRIAIDPGVGFGKTFEQNLELLRRLHELSSLGFPLVVGTSRKAFIGAALGAADPRDRVEGTAATAAVAVMNGAQIVRVHDVAEMARVARMADAIRTGIIER